MVDDLVRSGGTLIECHAVLAANGAKHGNLLKFNILHFLGYLVSAYVTHSVFPDKTWKRFKPEREGKIQGRD